MTINEQKVGTLLFLSNQKQATAAPVSFITYDLLGFEYSTIRSIVLRNSPKITQVLLVGIPDNIIGESGRPQQFGCLKKNVGTL